TTEDPRLAQFQPRVNRQDVVEAGSNVTGRGQRADRGFFADFALDAKCADDSAAAGSCIRWRLPIRRAVVGNQTADGPATGLAGQTGGELRIGNMARKEQHFRRLEKRRVLEKEGSLLGEEDLEALVDEHLRVVRFDLAEIRVQ